MTEISAIKPLCRLLFLLVVLGVLAGPAPAQADTDTPADTPIPVVSDIVEEWSIGGGLLYWANSCFAQEFAGPSTIKRQPVAGGPMRTLETTPAEKCLTYLNLAAADDGVYYFDDAEKRIERIPTADPYTPIPLVTLTPSQNPSGGPLEVTASHVYWTSFNSNSVLRIPRGGGPIETVASTAANPADVLVVGNTVYWIDNSGVWSVRNDCATLPCTDTKSQFSPFAANTSGYGLLYRSGTGINRFNYTLYRVERTTVSNNNDYKIRRRSCNEFSVCFNDATTFYTASTHWVIGYPVSDGTNIFWSERFFSVSTPDGKIRRKPIGTGDAADIVVNQPRVDFYLAIANGDLYFAVDPNVGPQGIFRLPLSASVITRDFVADAWEVTQAIQNTANAAPLVAKKSTYVRLYATQASGPNTTIVETKLYGTRNGIALPGSPLTPINGLRPLKTGTGYDRARLNDGWYFQLPASWTEGTVALRAEIDPRMAYSDSNRENNSLTGNFTFQVQPPVCVWTVPVRTNTPKPSTTDPNFWTMVDRFEARWPVPDVWIYRDTSPVEELQVCWYGPFPHPCYGPYELEDGWSLTNGPPDRDKVIVSLWARAQLSFNPDACDDIGAPVHFMGMVHPNANNGGAAGYASTVSKQSWVQLPPHTPNPAPSAWDAVPEGSTMAQELAHNFGRKHINCGNPDNIDNGYLYPPCQIAPVGPTSYYGFDTRTQTPIRPDGAADFMTYAYRTWVSDYTWRALLGKFAAASTEAVRADLADTVVYAAGFVDSAIPDGKLNHLLVLPQSALPPRPSLPPLATAKDPTLSINYGCAPPITPSCTKSRSPSPRWMITAPAANRRSSRRSSTPRQGRWQSSNWWPTKPSSIACGQGQPCPRLPSKSP